MAHKDLHDSMQLPDSSSNERSDTPSSILLSESDVFEDEGEFWEDLDYVSVYDLLGTNWRERAKRMMQKVSRSAKKLNDEWEGIDRRTKQARIKATQKAIQKIEKQWNKLENKLRNPQITRTRDKIAFFFGVTDLWFTAALAGIYPRGMTTWYTCKALILLGLRWGMYRRKHWHYFLADFCYLVNAILMVFLHVMPWSRTLFNILFACAHGPLAWAIVTWRNSMVFHSLDKMTSVFIHLSPPITLTTLRWLDTSASTTANPYYAGPNLPPRSEPAIMDVWESIIGMSVLYIVWQIAYYLFILKRRRIKVYEQGYLTSYTMLAHGSGAIARATGYFGENFRLPTFMALQYLYSVLTVIPAIWMSRFKWFEMAYLAFILSASIWNGANFYIHVFSSRYLRDLEKLEQEFRMRVASMSPQKNNTNWHTHLASDDE